jgi:predicted nucleic acid-binding Zn ribbon protein
MPKTRKKTCVVCRRSFAPSHALEKLCSPKCREERVRGQREGVKKARWEAGARPLAGRTCPVCGGTFDATSPARKYCSGTCSEEGLRRAVERQRERREREAADRGNRTPGQDSPLPEASQAKGTVVSTTTRLYQHQYGCLTEGEGIRYLRPLLLSYL